MYLSNSNKTKQILRRQCCLVKPTTRRHIDGHWNSWPWNRRWFYSSQGLTYVEIYFACFFFGCYGWRRYILAPFSLLVRSSHKKDTSCLQPRGQHIFFREPMLRFGCGGWHEVRVGFGHGSTTAAQNPQYLNHLCIWFGQWNPRTQGYQETDLWENDRRRFCDSTVQRSKAC